MIEKHTIELDNLLNNEKIITTKTYNIQDYIILLNILKQNSHKYPVLKK